MMILNKLSKLSSLILCTSFIALTVICYLSAISLLVAQTAKPNVVVIFCDDLGYGDLGGFGHPTIQTPHLDKMAAEGQKWTSFYAAASVCTPSRAGLLTGRLPVRNGMASDKRRVLFPDSDKGLPPDEITIAEMLKPQGYATAAIGKWHLGHLPPYLPTRHGFESYLLRQTFLLILPPFRSRDICPGAGTSSNAWMPRISFCKSSAGWRRLGLCPAAPSSARDSPGRPHHGVRNRWDPQGS